MDGTLASCPEITSAGARKYGAMVMVDDATPQAFMGPKAAGNTARMPALDVDILRRANFGQGAGGAIGGLYQQARSPVIDSCLAPTRAALPLQQLVAPSIGGSRHPKALELVEHGDTLPQRSVRGILNYWRLVWERLGFDVLPGETPHCS